MRNWGNHFKLGSTLLLTTLLLGCSTMSNINNSISDKFRGFYSNKPDTIGKQPTHLMPHKDQLFLKGPVKSASYFFTRPDFTGTQVTNEVHLDFNRDGYVTKITGSPKALKENGFLKYWELPPNTELIYDKNNAIDQIRTAESSHQYEYKGGPEEYGEKTGNLKSLVFEHIDNNDQKYRTLDYMIYGGNRYMVLSVDNRERDETVARIYEYQNGRLHKVYLHENNYPLDKKPSLALQDPLKYRFTLVKQIDYDLKGRIHHTMTSKRQGALITEDRISYNLKSDLPKRLTNINGTGAQQYRIRYKDYETDQNENWINRKVTTSYRRGNREGNDIRKIEYFELEK